MFVTSLPPLRVRDLGASPGDPHRHLPRGAIHLYSRGRDALGAAVNALTAPGAPVLLPAFICDSALEPFRGSGRPLVFYQVLRDLTVDSDSLEQELAAHPAAALVLVHYYGIPDPSLDGIVERARRHGAAVIEDCAHALYSGRGAALLGELGDAAVFSLRKSLPVPDGGVLVLRGGEDRITLRATGAADAARLLVNAAESALGVSPRTRLLASERIRRRAAAAEGGLGVSGSASMSRLAYRTLCATDGAAAAGVRRRNYEYLAALLAQLPAERLPHARLEAGVSPSFLPLLLPGRRDVVQSWMYRRDIAVRPLWDVLPSEVAPSRYAAAHWLRDSVLCLPVHHRLDPRHMERMVDVLGQSWRSV